MNVIRKSLDFSCSRLINQQCNTRRIYKISSLFETSKSTLSFSSLSKKTTTSPISNHGYLEALYVQNMGSRQLHIKIEPSEVFRSIAVTERVTVAKLGFGNNDEVLKLSPDEVVANINAEILKIFGVNSKNDIGNMETKDILTKLDSVFKIRVDGQPHVDFPAWLLPMLELPDLKMWEVSRQAWMDRSPSKGWIVFKGYFDTLNRLKKEGDL